MTKIQNPTLFSKYFNVSPALLSESGLVDPFVDVDTQLFIDPILLPKSTFKEISDSGYQRFRSHFQKFVRLLALSERRGDAAWKAATQFLTLEEPPENGLGYGGSGRSGNSRPRDIRNKILNTAKEIVDMGEKDPELISLMGFFEEDVGPDTISDFTTRVILPDLADLTSNFCDVFGIPTEKTEISDGSLLPVYKPSNNQKRPLVLVPKDIVRDLPIANDWSDIEEATFHNRALRDRVNGLLAGITQPTIAQRKNALRELALSSPESFEILLNTVKEHTQFYDPNSDALAYYRLKEILANGFPGIAHTTKYDLSRGPEEIHRIVQATLEIFKHHVENGNLWEELWIDGQPKKERASQLIYYAIADCFCRANNIDISPEANMGGGPIDFKFSKGYDARVLVEMKRDTGSVKHGYEQQLEIYKEASQTIYGIFVVMDFGKLGQKFSQIEAIRQQRLDAGEYASEIWVIDATRKDSASKRK
jgi:hypothetical protein